MESPVRPITPAISLALACVGCVAAPPPEPVTSEVTTKASPDNPACHRYTAQAVIDGKLQPIVGRACQQPDGTWTIVEGPPGKPNQYTTVYVPPPYAYYAYVDPWLWTAPIGLSVGAFIFVDRDHHVHDGHRFAHFGHMHRFEGRHGSGRSGGGGRLG
jgi:surface antigen